MTATTNAAFIPVVQANAGLRAFACEITGEEIALPDCLACAQQGAPGCPAFPALIHNIVKDPRPHDFSQQLAKAHGADFGISVTESIYCPRKFRLGMTHGWVEKPTDFYARVMGSREYHALATQTVDRNQDLILYLFNERNILTVSVFAGLDLLDALHRANCDALRGIEVSFAFDACSSINDVDHIAFSDRLSWALRLASAAGNAFVRNLHCHDRRPIFIDLAFASVRLPYRTAPWNGQN